MDVVSFSRNIFSTYRSLPFGLNRIHSLAPLAYVAFWQSSFLFPLILFKGTDSQSQPFRRAYPPDSKPLLNSLLLVPPLMLSPGAFESSFPAMSLLHSGTSLLTTGAGQRHPFNPDRLSLLLFVSASIRSLSFLLPPTLFTSR